MEIQLTKRMTPKGGCDYRATVQIYSFKNHATSKIVHKSLEAAVQVQTKDVIHGYVWFEYVIT